MTRHSRHLKRLAAPKHWMLPKMGGKYAPKPSSGPHKARECLPLTVLLRNRLNYAFTATEVKAILKRRSILIDGKVRTDPRFPAGFMDVVTIPSTNKDYRLVYDTKGRFDVLPIPKAEVGFKLCQVKQAVIGPKGIPVVHTHDGRTIRYPNPEIRKYDTLKVDLKTGKIMSFIKFDIGNTCMVTKGKNTGRVGTIARKEAHAGSFNIIHLTDSAGREFCTRTDNVFVLGAGKTSEVKLPSLKGLKLSIQDDRKKRLNN